MADDARQPVPCVVAFTNVCLADHTLYVDGSSKCDGLPCKPGTWFDAGRMNALSRGEVRNALRFPALHLQPLSTLSSSAELNPRERHGVALLPSGLETCAYISKLPKGSPMRQCDSHSRNNMAHLLYDTFLHELDIARVANVTVVLGDSFVHESLNVVHAMRRRLFSRARFQSAAAGGCFSQLYSYSWSCDRLMTRYMPGGEQLWHLQRLAPPMDGDRGNERLGGVQRVLLLYGRSDASRRRLLNMSHHYAAFRASFEPAGWQVVSWDHIWSTRPTVEEQGRILRKADVVVTPHGALPSTWGLLLRPGAVLFEIMTRCYPCA